MKPATSHTALLAVMIATALGALATTDAFAQARSVPTFTRDANWPQVPPQWKVGDVSSIAINAEGHSFVLSRPRTLKPEDASKAAPPVMVFDQDGKFVKSWGGNGPGYEWVEREHGITIDSKGVVWVGGNSCPSNGLPGLKPVADDQLLKFDQNGKIIAQFGKSNQSKGNADTGNFHRPADAALHTPTNELFIADGYGNHRVIVVDADTGAFKRMWGAYANKPADDDHCDILRRTDFSEPGSPQFSVVHSLKVSTDGIVYVADREFRRVQTFSLDGKYIKQFARPSGPFAKNLAFSPDPEQTFLYVGGDKDIAILDRKTMTLAGTITDPGVLGGGHHIATDAKGNIYVAGTGAGMSRLLYKGMSAAR